MRPEIVDVVAGHDDGLARLAAAARAAGARCVRRLDMAVPSHCVLLDRPAAELAQAARDTVFNAPAIVYFSANARRRLWQADAIRNDLVYTTWRSRCTGRQLHVSCTNRDFTWRWKCRPPACHRLQPTTEPPGEAMAVIDTGWHNVAALTRRATAANR